MSRVEARFSDSLSMVAISSTVGKALNSNGRAMNSDTIRMRTENVIDRARLKSSSQLGIGMIRTIRMAITPKANKTSVWRSVEKMRLAKCSSPVEPAPATVSVSAGTVAAAVAGWSSWPLSAMIGS